MMFDPTMYAAEPKVTPNQEGERHPKQGSRR